MGVAVPMKSGSGSNVTVPLALTVYVPSSSTCSVVTLQVFGVCPLPHNFKVALFAG